MKHPRSAADAAAARSRGNEAATTRRSLPPSHTPGGRWIAVVDDDEAIQELIAHTLGTAGYTVRTAGSAEDAIELVRNEVPTLVITDISLPGQSGYELCHILRERFGEALPIIFISGVRTEPFDQMAGFLLGADDFIVKPFDPGDILVHVRRALARSATLSGRDAPGQDHDLTAREREVLGLLADGLSQKQIAAKLVISSTTVATHIQRILGKLQLHSRAEAVAWAYRTGVLGTTVEPAAVTHLEARRAALRSASL
jgi:DNA-binding NarL/FixJ family response regulator